MSYYDITFLGSLAYLVETTASLLINDPTLYDYSCYGTNLNDPNYRLQAYNFADGPTAVISLYNSLPEHISRSTRQFLELETRWYPALTMLGNLHNPPQSPDQQNTEPRAETYFPWELWRPIFPSLP